MTVPVVVFEGPWRAEWSGGRLADIYHAEFVYPLHSVEVGEYDYALSHDELERSRAELGAGDVHEALHAFIAEDGATYLANS